MSCFTKGLLIEVLEARHELSRLGYTIDYEDFLEVIAEDNGNGGCWRDETNNLSKENAVSLLACVKNPETFDEFAFLVKELLLADALADTEFQLPIHWRISW